MNKLAATIIGLGALLASNQALAESSNAEFSPELSRQVAEFPWESGWLPSEDATVRINLQAAARQNVLIALPGESNYDWDDQELVFRGDENEGLFQNEVDVDITATVAFTIFGVTTEGDIGIYHLNRLVSQDFTPYALPGNVDAPVTIADQIGPFNLVEEPFELGPAVGTFYLDWVIDIPGVTFEGTSIDVTDDPTAGNLVEVTTENEAVPMVMPGAEPGAIATLYATEYGLLNSEMSVRLMPYLEMTAYGVDFTVGPLDVELSYPVVEDEEVAFDQIALDYDVPEAPEEPDPDPEDPEDPEEPEEPGTTGDEPEPGTTGDEPEPMGDTDGEPMGDTDSAGLGGVQSDNGCGCSTDGDHRKGALAAGFLGALLLGLRRRRN